MRNDDLSQRLFADECDDAIAGLARRALERLPPDSPDGEVPAWLDSVTNAPPAVPPELLAAALATPQPAGGRRGTARPPAIRKIVWLWGGSVAVAALAGLLLMRAAPPPAPAVAPAQMAETLPAEPARRQMAMAPENEVPPPPPPIRPSVKTPPQTAAAPRIAAPRPVPPSPAARGTVQVGDWEVMPGKPSLATVDTTPRLRKALAAYLAEPDETGRAEVLAALEAAGLTLSAPPAITRIRIDSALADRLPAAPPSILRVVVDGRGGLSLAE